MVDPRGPEEEALLGVAGRVVGERVEQRVEDLEAAQQVGRERREVAHRRPQLLHERARGAHERADLVLDDRRRLRAGTGASARSAGPSARAPGPQRLRASGRARRRASRPCPARSASPSAPTAAPAASRAGSRPGSRATRTPRWSSPRTRRAGRPCRRARRRRARSCGSPRLMFSRRVASCSAIARVSRASRLEAADRVRQLAPVAAQRPARRRRAAAAGSVRVSPSSTARISSRLTSGSVWPIGIRWPSSSSPASFVPGVSSATMSFRPVLGRSSTLAFVVDRDAVLLELERHDRLAVLEPHARDLADLDAGDVDRLALARRDRLGGRELRLDLGEVLAEHREPAGQRQPLVGEDHRRHGERDDDQAEDRQEVDEVLADRRHRDASGLCRTGGSCRAASAAARVRAVAGRGRRRPGSARPWRRPGR